MENKEKLKELREQRKHIIKKIQEKVKEQNKIKNSIKNILKNGPKTPIEISEALKISSNIIMWYIASLKKYGEIIEGEKSGDYFTYVLNPEIKKDL